MRDMGGYVRGVLAWSSAVSEGFAEGLQVFTVWGSRIHGSNAQYKEDARDRASLRYTVCIYTPCTIYQTLYYDITYTGLLGF